MTSFIPNISVIIPVYNAEKFIEKAVISAIEQAETAEVILIEDNSSDDSFEICRSITQKFKQVKLLSHDDKTKNHGAGNSRNVGIKAASFPYIAFLDADDFYNPDRFSLANKILLENPLIDGVYEAIGTYCYDQESEKKHFERMRFSKKNHNNLELTTLDNPVKPEELFQTLLFGENGWIHLNGLTIRKNSLLKTGFFDEDLRWSEDDEFFLRISYSLSLLPGRLHEPVAMRGVHDKNFTLSESGNLISRQYNILLWKKMIRVMLSFNFNKKINRLLTMRRLDFYNIKILSTKKGNYRKLLKAIYLIKLITVNPMIIRKIL